MFTLKKQLILGSGSKIRQKLLASVDLNFTVEKSTLDESTLKSKHEGLTAEALSLVLAKEKALAISDKYPQHIVIACDQVCCCENKIFDKPGVEARCIEQLQQLAGKTHQLYSAICLASDRQIVWTHIATATLTMRQLSDTEIRQYVAKDKPFHSCGSYYFESLGRHLFREIRGEQDTVLGLPLIPLLNALYDYGFLQVAEH